MKTRFTLVITLLGSLCLVSHPAGAASLALDTNFRTPLFAEAYPAGNMLLLGDGKYLLFGTTNTLSDQRTGVLTRYFPNGTLDTTFSFNRDYKFIAAAASASNGQLIVAATQYLYNGSRTEQIIRLNADGSIDPSFTTAIVGSDPFSRIRAIVIQPDGKILVAGTFDTFGGLPRQKIVRLLSAGTPDSGFTPPTFPTGSVGIYAKPAVLANGKILIAGDFSNVNGAANLGVAQLNADGSVDSGFQAAGFSRGSGNGTPIRGLVLQSDGKIVLGGRFQSPGQVRALVRLNADGSADASYVAPALSSSVTRNLVIQSDDKVVGAIGSSIYRFTLTGSLDSSFTAQLVLDTTFSLFGDPGTPLALSLESDGQVLFAGTFTDVSSSGVLDGSHFGVARLNSDGTLDPTLVTSHKTGLEDFPTTFARQPDGSTIIAFGIQFIKNEPPMAFNLGRLLPNGLLDPSFSLSSSNPDSVLSQSFVAQDFVQLADGRLFVFGVAPDLGFTAATFFSNGTEDLTFHFAFGYFQKATAAPDGKVLLSAGSDPQATLESTLSRLDRNGSFDGGFALPGSIMLEQVIRDGVGDLVQLFVGSHVLAIQTDGKILFEYFSSDSSFHLLRLNTDGSVDNSFTATTLAPFDLTLSFPVVFDPLTFQVLQPPGGAWSATPPVADAQILTDGRIVLCGPFTSFNGAAARGVVRLLANGTIDNTFAIGGGAQWTQTTETSSFFPSVDSIEGQVDGKLLIVGTFEAFDGAALPGIASLNPDGSVDASFTPLAKRQKFARGATRFARQADGSFLLSGSHSFPNENEPTFIHINSIGGIPIIGSPALATAIAGQFFSYQIVASGQPNSYSASGLPPGFSIDPATGLITGTPSAANVGTYTITVTATNAEGTSATFQLVLTILPPATPTTLLNISTRLRVLTGDNALIGGFIITGTAPKRVIVRAIGPSLTDSGVPGALTDPVLELHGPGGFITITNDNWRDTQQSEIEATGIPPSNNLESAIVATLPPGAYTAIVRGQSDGTGVGLVEAYDLDSAADSQLANISTRGFVDTGENVMIGGLIGGPASAGGGPMLVRAIGPSLGGVQGALQDPTLELRNGAGSLIASNDDWRDTQQAAIEATGIQPSNEKESAILSTLAPGNYTAIVRGTNNGTGVGLVEVYNLQ
jgi:uncharacterized delta-60 repeat protein